MTTPEERITFFKSIELFPVCGHHRVQASIELAEETKKKEWLIWNNVKIVAPPEGEEWEDNIRLLGIYDNRPFGKRMSFYDQMVMVRRQYVNKYMDPDNEGHLKKPIKKTMSEFQSWIAAVCDCRSATAKSNYATFVNRSEVIWNMLVQLMLGHVKNAHEDHWHNLNAPSTLHAMGGLPDSMVAPVLQRIINREIDIKTANAEMQAAQREARCKKHIVIVANQLRPNVITSVDTTDFSEVVEHYPNLNLIWAKYLGYFNTRTKPHQRGLAAMNNDVLYQIEYHERQKEGTLIPTIAKVPMFLKHANHPLVKLSYYRESVFVMINSTTENAP